MLNKLAKLTPVFYKDLSSSIKGRSRGLWIEIDNKYKDDLGLLAHERCHARQFLKTFMLHGVMYRFSQKYRYKAEVEAYGYSLHYGNRTIENVKYVLTNHYNIDSKTMKWFASDIKKSIANASKDFEELI